MSYRFYDPVFVLIKDKFNLNKQMLFMTRNKLSAEILKKQDFGYSLMQKFGLIETDE